MHSPRKAVYVAHGSPMRSVRPAGVYSGGGGNVAATLDSNRELLTCMTHQEDLHSRRVRDQYSGSRGAEWAKARLRPLVTCSDCSLFLPRESD